jgi:hypothetical protein
VTPADRLVPDGHERTTLQDGISHMHQNVASAPFLAPLVSRDLIWLLDVFGDDMDGSERIERAQKAVALDQGFVCAHSRLALATALVGDWPRARRAADEALAIAETVDRHDDPLVEALALKVAVSSKSATRTPPPPPGEATSTLWQRVGAVSGGSRAGWSRPSPRQLRSWPGTHSIPILRVREAPRPPWLDPTWM